MKKEFVIAMLCGVVIASSVAFLTPNDGMGAQEADAIMKLAGCNCGKPKDPDTKKTEDALMLVGCNCGKPKDKGGETKKS